MAGASLIPEFYTPRINHAFFLAPVTTFRGTTNTFVHFWARYGLGAFQALLELAGGYDLIPYDAVSGEYKQDICKLWDGLVCETVDSIFINADPELDDTRAVLSMLNYTPSGAGYRDFIHYW